MDDSNRLLQVSSFYGPGTFYGWLCTLLSIIVTWTARSPSGIKDIMDSIAALSFPTIASIHLLVKLQQYPRSINDLLTRQDDDALQLLAAVQAPLSICEAYATIALALSGIAFSNGDWKRSFGVFTIGVLSFLTQIIVLVGARDTTSPASPFAGTLVLNILRPIIAMIIVITLWAAVSLGRLLVQPTPESTDRQPAQKYKIWLSAALVWVPLCALNLTMSFIQTPSSLQPCSTSLIPKTASSIRDLDQAAAFGTGVLTLALGGLQSIFGAEARRSRERERFKFDVIQEERILQTDTTISHLAQPQRAVTRAALD